MDYTFSVSGDTISAVIALSDLGLTAGQEVGYSAFQEGASDGWAVDFVESDSLTLKGAASAPVTSVDDPKDMADSSGDIKNISAHVEGDNLHLSMTVYGIAAPSVDDTPEGMKNRYYYHWLFDTDSDIATGFKNDAYEGNPTGLAKPIGADLVVQFGWRDGKPNGVARLRPRRSATTHALVDGLRLQRQRRHDQCRDRPVRPRLDRRPIGRLLRIPGRRQRWLGRRLGRVR